MCLPHWTWMSDELKTFLSSSHIPLSHILLLLSFHHAQTIGGAIASMATNALSDDFRAYLEGCNQWTRARSMPGGTPSPVQLPV